MIIIFCGDRNWTDAGWIRMVMSAIKNNIGTFTVMDGGARGADKMACHIAKYDLNLPSETLEADWNQHGKAAGPIRNSEMLKHGGQAIVAFHLNIAKSKGTGDMVRQARKAGRPVWICTDGDEALMQFILQLRRIKNAENV